MVTKTEREYGIDLLRIVSMLMIVVLHTLGRGGILDNTTYGTGNYYAAWFLDIAAFCAVNCYALISGYVMVNENFKVSRIIKLWMQVLFYSIGITVAFLIVDKNAISAKVIVKSFFPILTSLYWYVTAYVGLFFFIPFINKAINSFDKNNMQKLVLCIIVMFSILPTVFYQDLFATRNGVSTIWLISLYIIGAYIKKYDPLKRFNKSQLLLYAACVCLTWLSKIVIEIVSRKLFSTGDFSLILVKYSSPFMLFAAIFLLIFFSRLQIKAGIIIKITLFFSPISLAVYIIQTHPVLWDTIFINRFTFLSTAPLGALLMGTIGISISVYIVLALVDFLRSRIFVLVRLPKLADQIAVKITDLFNKNIKQ